MRKDAARTEEKKTPFIDRWIKSMLLGRESDGYERIKLIVSHENSGIGRRRALQTIL
jgi:hypothetical protein